MTNRKTCPLAKHTRTLTLARAIYCRFSLAIINSSSSIIVLAHSFASQSCFHPCFGLCHAQTFSFTFLGQPNFLVSVCVYFVLLKNCVSSFCLFSFGHSTKIPVLLKLNENNEIECSVCAVRVCLGYCCYCFLLFSYNLVLLFMCTFFFPSSRCVVLLSFEFFLVVACWFFFACFV